MSWARLPDTRARTHSCSSTKHTPVQEITKPVQVSWFKIKYSWVAACLPHARVHTHICSSSKHTPVQEITKPVQVSSHICRHNTCSSSSYIWHHVKVINWKTLSCDKNWIGKTAIIYANSQCLAITTTQKQIWLEISGQMDHSLQSQQL